MSKPEIDLEKIDALRNAFNAMVVSHQPVSVGDIVIINPANEGFFRFPTVDHPGIVTELLPHPKRGWEFEDNASNTPASAMIFDCIVHIVDEDGDVIPFLMDSRRLLKV